MDSESEAQEYTSVTFEWKLKGLKALFETTKGDSKSKVVRSGKFDNGRWQILFYANAGLPRDHNCPDGCVSLYLSCDPTPQEKESGMADSGRWKREGKYRFSFELKTIDKNVSYGSKEATDHQFTFRTANWGWAQFARRDTIYYNCPPIRAQDALLIVCTVVSEPRPLVPPPTHPYLPAPKPLLDMMGSLLDDPTYSDIEFVFPRGRGLPDAKRLYASKKILSRTEYFQIMFASDFAEGNLADAPTPGVARTLSGGSNHSAYVDEFEDSDEENEEDDGGLPSMTGIQEQEEYHDAHGDSDAMEDQHAREGSPESHSEAKGKDELGIPSIQAPSKVPGPAKTVIEVKDVAYRTYKSILYWLYTDHIVFAPLSSSFNKPQHYFSGDVTQSLPTTPAATADGTSNQPGAGLRGSDLPATREAWIAEWTREFPGRPEPCSAKAVYRVADKIDIPELKERASQHIMKSLTVDNIAYEVFSPFSAIFEDIRKVEITFFLNHWHQIRSSESMVEVWRQIRSGRHPGFEEVWPLIVQSLEFKPSAPATTTNQVIRTLRYHSDGFTGILSL
ncbi:hypothetical protein BKA70DRAFT_1397844 [Coprinopsis sp. MPI-PUGE-AT-0042]|nr:hypothetical protein BKA70DRAFT_1397844 [Coprinopsis sp. MPI-PUGE-AT-0042]